ncbi:hypothetical protein PYCCODRAFT_1439492 [Trametes coccinea BRFM310]|uniref:Uncharacterized protein n=1 Tax=Trametes coccinea (strain BRFM310) TaxID=1353009 RepID=A0A1Y2IAL6_TRAC3|nr:hypothetical protein PYCCODRAFT_1439492 [Trametes coccinea BRFM310]
MSLAMPPSRMVDELAKQTFCIPMSLGSTSAYLPQDVDVVHYFHSSLCLSPNFMRTQRVQLFMYALFETALARVKAIASEIDSADKSMSDIASRFRQLMSDGMEYGRHGQYRQEFYADVCKRAAELPSQTKIFIVPGADDETPIVVVKDKTGNWTNLTTAAKALTSYFSKVATKSSAGAITGTDLILCFDEAQLFTRCDSIDAEVTLLPDVQRALRLIRALPIFALFLSTVITVENVSPPPQISSSERLLRPHDVPFRPIVWTPIDVLAARITNDKVWTLTEVASTHHIAHLGRPLFAAMYDAALAEGDHEVNSWIVNFALQKLLKALPPETLSLQQALACIAVRIPLEFDPAPLSPPVGNDADVERNLVADHMRLLLYADRGFSRIVTTAASEPLLAEAAGSKMISSR